MKKFLTLTIVFILLGIVSQTPPGAVAQTNQANLLLTWSANNYFPANFSGKAIPTPGSRVDVSLEIVRGSRLLDLSRANFYWYVDGRLTSRGENQKEFYFSASKPSGENHFVRVVVNSNGENFENSLRIPVSKPTVVIEVPYPQNVVPARNKIFLEAVPYFWNVTSLKNLNFSWNINGSAKDAGSDNQLTLDVGTPQNDSDRTIQLKSFVRNKTNPLEFGEESKNLFIY